MSSIIASQKLGIERKKKRLDHAVNYPANAELITAVHNMIVGKLQKVQEIAMVG